MKVDDTTVGVEAGRNAGMWAIGVAQGGNLVGLSEAEFERLRPVDQQSRLRAAYDQLYAAGAHIVIDTIADLPAALDHMRCRRSTRAILLLRESARRLLAPVGVVQGVYASRDAIRQNLCAAHGQEKLYFFIPADYNHGIVTRT